MAIKDNIDFSTFSDPLAAFDLFSNSIRRSFTYDSYGNKTKFTAVVLSNPIPISPTDLQYFNANAIVPSEKVSKFVYRARILGENSPHQFLPNPCDTTYASDVDAALQIVAMHTLFVSTVEEGVGKSLPRLNSTVEVELTKNAFSYNLQYGKHLSVVDNPSEPSASTADCDKISQIMANATTVSSIASVSAGASSLQQAYMNLQRQQAAPSPDDDAKYVYGKLLAALSSENLVLGIMANAEAESGFKRYIVSGATGESSLGLWQMNVGRDQGSYGAPRESIQARATEANLPPSIIIPKAFKGIPYFAGALMVKEAGVAPIGTSNYTGQDVSTIYNIATDIDKQIAFVIKSANSMLSSLNAATDSITAEQWADWWQIYFEQPGSYHSRGHAVGTVRNRL